MFRTGTHQSWLVWMVMAFMGFFAISQGAVIWVYMSEVFPTRVRAKGQAIGTSTLWVMNALISGSIPGAREEIECNAIFLLCDHDAR